MHIHEYQAKKLLADAGIPVLKGMVALTGEEAVSAASAIGGNVWAVKAQIHAGGRGKAGGVKIAKSREEVRFAAEVMLGSKLVTSQTGPSGKKVNKVYIEQGCDIACEYYLGITYDTSISCITIAVSECGGVEIEETAKEFPEKIIKVNIKPEIGFTRFYAVRLADALHLSGNLEREFSGIVEKLYNIFVTYEAVMLEINPLAITADGNPVVLDAKAEFDDSALYRRKNIADMRDHEEENSRETGAAKNKLQYIELDGDIGCMVNGAGLAMATTDIIKLYGGNPANFLDIGGSADKDRVTEAFKLLLSDKRVKVILVNIFAGIIRCDIIAGGIVAAVREADLKVPLIVRLAGTNAELGKEILAASGLPIITVGGLDEAAIKSVETARIGGR